MIESEPKRAVFFDLDDTLVLSSALEPLRRLRVWDKVYASFGLTSLPPGTEKVLAELTQRGLSIGIITKSPRAYAERIVGYHKLPIKVLVAYHDVAKRKPHPDSLLKAASLMGAEPAGCFYVGDHQDDVDAARAAGFGVLAVNWTACESTLNHAPICTSWEQIVAELDLLIKSGEHHAKS